MRDRMVALLLGVLLCGLEALASPPAADETANPCSSEVPLRFVRGLPVATLALNGEEVELMIDLGGFDAIHLDAAVVAELSPRFTGRKRSFKNAHGQKLTAREFLLEEVTVGSRAVEGVRGLESVRTPAWAPGFENGYVGLELLRRFGLAFDYAGGKMRLDDEDCPAAEAPDSSSWRVVGMSSMKDGVRLPLTIDGRKASVVLDTGASYSTLRPRAAEAGARVHTRHGEFYRPVRMTVAGAEMTPVEFYVMDLPGPGTDGILGCNFFAENEVRVDFRNETVAFRPVPPPSPHPCPSPVGSDDP